MTNCQTKIFLVERWFFIVYGDYVEIRGKDREVLIGEPVLSRYERARVVGARALQVSQGAPVLIDVDSEEFQPITVAKQELKARVLPVGFMRKIPNGTYQIIPVQWLKDREFITQMDIETEEED